MANVPGAKTSMGDQGAYQHYAERQSSASARISQTADICSTLKPVIGRSRVKTEDAQAPEARDSECLPDVLIDRVLPKYCTSENSTPGAEPATQDILQTILEDNPGMHMWGSPGCKDVKGED